MKRRICTAICILAIFSWGCPDDDASSVEIPDAGPDAAAADTAPEPDTAVDEGVPASIVFPTDTFVVEENEPTDLSADVLDANGHLIEDAFITWESADPSILRISSGGFALGEQPGTTELIATSGDITEHWPAEVVATLVGDVTVIPAEAHLLAGATIPYDVLIEDHAGFPIDDDRPVQWSTTDSDVATIDNDGALTGVAAGEAEVIAEVEGVEGRADVVVTDADVATIQVTPAHPPAIPEAGELQLQATAYDVENNPLQGYTAQWSSSDTDVTTVDDQGLVVGISQGDATITASIEGLEDSVDVEVTFEIQSVASGDGFSCAIATNRLFCWGENDRGQLADGGFQSHSDAQPADFPHAVDQIALGSSHGCLLDDEGQLHCWGDNEDGQLGTSAGDPEPTPRLVTSNQNFQQVTAGTRHTCALTEDNEVYCWGDNSHRQLGHSAGSTHTPTPVSGGPDFESVTAGTAHTCAVGTDSTTYCWGDNSRQQLGGDTEASTSTSPVPVIGGNEFSTISAGSDFTCGIAASGPPACWGANDRGQLGSSDTTDHGVPRSLALQPGQSLNAISSGDVHTCGIVPGEGPHCWGAYDDGRLGTGADDDVTEPGPIDSDEDFSEIAAGASHVCGRTPDHDLFCWGDAPADGVDLEPIQF